MPIPTTKSKPVAELSKLLTLIWGAPKCGKSTLASSFPEAAFIATEDGLRSLEVVRWEYPDGGYVMRTWEDLLTATNEIIQSKRFKTVVIDTLGNLCALCDQHVCAKAGEDYRGDGKLGYGKGATMIVNELKRYLTKLSGSGIGVVLIAHGAQKTVTTRAGEVVKQIPHVPGDNKSGDIYSLILGMCDLVLYVDVGPDGKRTLRTKPSMTYDAGDRTGRLPESLDCTYAALAAAFAPAAAPVSPSPKSPANAGKVA